VKDDYRPASAADAASIPTLDSLMKEIILRFLVGGAVVSFFAVAADMLKPKSFAGLLGAAPSVALATLTLTVMKDGKSFAQSESVSMMLGAIAFFFYAWFVSWLLVRKKLPTLAVTASSTFLWLAAAFGLWFVILR
jgi:uncharacterized membrane protein (GlpM family)